jgi:streptomycin 6-kinase
MDHRAVPIAIPDSFAAMPRWWSEGEQWLRELPGLIYAQCARWDLRVDGQPAHGSNAIVIPVVRGDSRFALRLTPPLPEIDDEVRALRFWDGRGTVRLFEADPARGATLLELLAAHQSLADQPVPEAMTELGRMMRRLAVPAPASVTSTATLAAEGSAELEREWHEMNEPFDAAILAEAVRVSPSLSASEFDVAVNGDLHSAQVLRGEREDWLTVDPKLLRGDIEYDLARVLWTRLDEMATASDIVRQFDTVVAASGIDRDRARDWVIFRTVDYWLWGLGYGLTEDPVRCARLAAALMT